LLPSLALVTHAFVERRVGRAAQENLEAALQLFGSGHETDGVRS